MFYFLPLTLTIVYITGEHRMSKEKPIYTVSSEEILANLDVDQDQGAPSPELIEPFVKTVKNGKVASFVNGQSCGDQPSEVQVFAYKLNEKEKTYSQTKLTNPAEYAIAQKSEVPPGDCIIFEFGPASARTDKLCKQYGVRDKAKCERFGVSGNGRKICELTEVR